MVNETNRIPSDLPEPEPESVAGFITEYSSIYYSIIVLTEYTNIIALILFMITIYSLPSEILLLVLYTTSLTRPTLVRLKFDELMINVWIILSPIMFILLVLVAVPIWISFVNLLIVYCLYYEDAILTIPWVIIIPSCIQP